MAKTAKLETYRKKRDFAHTPEPSGVGRKSKAQPKASAKKKTAAKSAVKGRVGKVVKAQVKTMAGKAMVKTSGRGFVIQKHAATRLHYDFRIEVGGVLKSWAVPKGPSMNPLDKRLAVLVEDHPLDYADFEGTIPEPEYGAGTVMVWDRGQYFNLKLNADGSEVPMDQTFADGRIEIWLEGTKLRGGFALVKTRLVGKQEQWLLIKMKDQLAESKGDNTEDKPDSAKTGRTMESITNSK